MRRRGEESNGSARALGRGSGWGGPVNKQKEGHHVSEVKRAGK